MGATDPAKADAGTIRKDVALSIGENSVHGSDAAETAAIEIAQFFSGNEVVGRPTASLKRPRKREGPAPREIEQATWRGSGCQTGLVVVVVVALKTTQQREP